MSEKISPSKAIKEYCKMCMGLEKDEKSSLVKECPANKPFGIWDKCPLYDYRLGRYTGNEKEKDSLKSEKARERMKKLHEEGKMKKKKKDE